MSSLLRARVSGAERTIVNTRIENNSIYFTGAAKPLGRGALLRALDAVVGR